MIPKSVKNHILFTKHALVKEVCAPLNKIQISGCIFMRQYADGRIIDLGTNLEWSEFFLSRFFQEEYPAETFQDHILANKNIILWNAYPDNIIWQEGAKYFNCGNGISLCFPTTSYKDIFCFYTSVNNVFINDFYLQNINTLKKFCHYFLSKLQSVIARSEVEKDFLITPEKYLQPTKPKPKLDDYIDNFLTEINTVENNKISSTSRLHVLSTRELECLKLCLLGNTAKQIAKILNISPRTVETHLQHSKEKINCDNLKQLISIASAEGLCA